MPVAQDQQAQAHQPVESVQDKPEKDNPSPGKQKIAILGGGMAGLAAAYELTRYPDWKDRYEVTLYQLGWRLGGKAATGRGPNARIQEHGIHILQGWYENTFRLLLDVYRERKAQKLAPNSPLQDLFTNGLQPNNATLLTEFHPEAGGWKNWPLVFPTNSAIPGEGLPLSHWEIIKKMIAVALETLLGSPYAPKLSKLARFLLSLFFPKDGAASTARQTAVPHLIPLIDLACDVEKYEDHHLTSKLLELVSPLVEQMDKPPAYGASQGGLPPHITTLLDVLENSVRWLETQVSEAPNENNEGLNHLLLLIEFGWVNLKGILQDVWSWSAWKFDYDRINTMDYRKWIQGHGASPRLLKSSMVRFVYTGTFANLVSDSNQPEKKGGLIAAGTALQFLVQAAGYKGSFTYQFRKGTGDTMVMPLYEVLAHRGVRFEFFQKVEQLHASATGEIERISVGQQVTLKNGTYAPAQTLGTLQVWPGQPLYEQIDPQQAEQLKTQQIDLENPWAEWTNPSTCVLTRGQDFDQIILAIPVAALKDICSEIIGSETSETQRKWKDMVEQVKTTATLSLQLWLKPNLEQLGMVLAEWGLAPKDCAPNVVVYADPLYSWVDSSLVLEGECWPTDTTPKMLAYYTGSMLDGPLPPYSDHGFHQQQLENVRQTSQQWLTNNMSFFWPKGTTAEAPSGLNLDLLIGASPNAVTPEQKFASQYFRANVAPSERYTLSLPGSARYRLRTDQSGFRNLFLAGDWIDFGVNVGYIEGAVISGLQAAQAMRKALGCTEALPIRVAPDVA